MSAAANLEVEVKIPVSQGADHARRLIENRGFQISIPRMLESNTVFDHAGELRDSGQLLRLRLTGGIQRITYKGPPHGGRHKTREEIEFDISDPNAFTQVLERLGYQPGFRYEKYRTTYAIPGEAGLVTVDETPIGVFLELEGAPDWIDRTAGRLGFSPHDYLTASYASLYLKYRLDHPGAPEDMTW